mgnify:CR=1 FL=1
MHVPAANRGTEREQVEPNHGETAVAGVLLAVAREAPLRMKNRLKVLRAERDWSQADLGAQLSVSRQTFNAIETGKYDPSLPLALKMARLFGQAVDAIFFPDE